MTSSIAARARQFFFYLLFFTGAVGVYNFLAVFLQGQGLSGTQIGGLMGLSALIGLAAGPLWSGLADSTRQHRLILSMSIVGNALPYLLFPVFHTFGAFLVLTVVGSIFGAPVLSMVDNATMTLLGNEREMYGRLRLGGTIGWGAMAPVIGFTVQQLGIQWIFWLYGVSSLVGVVLSQGMRFSPRPPQASFTAGLKQLLTDSQWIVFLWMAFIAGTGSATIGSYYFLYLQKLGTTPTLMGWAITISTVAEAPALFFANRFIRRLGSLRLLTVGMLGVAVRCMLYGLVSQPWAALSIQLLQFVTFPILWVAGVSYADEHAPRGMGATGQSIFGSAFQGLGPAAGAFVGGVLIQAIGVQQMYLVVGEAVLLVALLFLVLQRTLMVRQPA